MLTTLRIAVCCMVLLTLAVGVAGAAGEGTALVWSPGLANPDAPDWIGLHRLAGGQIGLLPEAGMREGGEIRQIDTYDPKALYMLVSPPDRATLERGELPVQWARAVGVDGAPDAGILRGLRFLCSDGVQSLVRLPESLRGVLREPGGRVQELPRVREVELRTAPPAPPPVGARDAELWQALANAANSDRLFADLDYLSTTLQTRYYSTPEMDLACEYVLAEFETLGLTAYFAPFTYHGHELKNVVGVTLGSVDPAQIYIVCGHLDSISPEGETLAPGAEDNGSGSAAVLEAARLLASLPCDYTIYFICFSAEEQGLVGSEHFASQAAAEGLDIRAVLNLDMVAYHEPQGDDLWVEGFYDGVPSVWLMDLVQANAETYADLLVYRYEGNGWGSDHVPFHEYGYPAVLSIDNEWYNYPCYHQTCDTVDWLDANLWRSITATNAVSVAQLAQVQASVGTLDGHTVLAGGGGLAGVSLHLAGTGYAERVSAADGYFVWNAIFPGTYTLVAEKSGYETVTEEVTITGGETTTVQLVLEPVGSDVADAAPGSPHVRLQIMPSSVVDDVAIRLDLPAPAMGRLAVYGADGRLVGMPLRWADHPQGAHTLTWRTRHTDGTLVPAGLYWVRWEEVGHSISKRFVVVR